MDLESNNMKRLSTIMILALFAIATVYAQTYSKELEEKAANGDKLAMMELGYCYQTGSGIQQDYAKAYECYKASQGENHPKTLYCRGMMYRDGIQVQQDLNKAFELVKQAAELSDDDAMYRLSVCYRFGYGTSKNLEKAEYWLKKAQDAGNDDAQGIMLTMDNQSELHTSKPTAFEVEISSNVSDATMYIDDNNYGTPNGVRMLKSGFHSVKLKAKGYFDYDTIVTVSQNSTNYNFVMKRKYVTGYITDEKGEGLPCTITVQGTDKEAFSSFSNGRFVIEARDGDVLNVNYFNSNFKYNGQFTVKPGQSDMNIIIDKSKSKSSQKRLVHNNQSVDSNSSESVTTVRNYRTVTGLVSDSTGEPLIGATIMVKGSNRGVAADVNGCFSINVWDNEVLDISYVGYKTMSIKVNPGQSELKVVLESQD